MKRIVLYMIVVIGVLAPTAHAKLHTTAPQGISGIQEYLESVPTDSGSRPTNSIHTAGAAGGGHNGGGPSAGGSITPSTQRRLAAQGSAGVDAAALARATAPRVSRPTSPTSPTGVRLGSGSDSHGAGAAIHTSGGRSPVGAIADTLTGSTSSGGLGTLLPVILIAALVLSAALAVLRRRGAA